MDKLKEKLDNLPTKALFFHKLRHMTRLYRQFSKHKAEEHKREELNARANLEIATARLHEDIYNIELQGEVNHYKHTIDEIESGKQEGQPLDLGSNARKWGTNALPNSLLSKTKEFTCNHFGVKRQLW